MLEKIEDVDQPLEHILEEVQVSIQSYSSSAFLYSFLFYCTVLLVQVLFQPYSSSAFLYSFLYYSAVLVQVSIQPYSSSAFLYSFLFYCTVLLVQDTGVNSTLFFFSFPLFFPVLLYCTRSTVVHLEILGRGVRFFFHGPPFTSAMKYVFKTETP